MRLLFVWLLFFTTLTLKAQDMPYVNQTDVGLLIGNKTTGLFSFQSFNGVNIAKLKLHIGVVTGIDFYTPLHMIPLAPGLKFFPFPSKKTNVFMSLNAGYAFSGTKKLADNQSGEGGLLFNPSFGVRFESAKKAAFNLNFGYKSQKGSIVTYTNSFANPRNKDKLVDAYTFRRLSVTMGVSF